MIIIKFLYYVLVIINICSKSNNYYKVLNIFTILLVK